MNASTHRGRAVGLVLSLAISGAILAYLFAQLDWPQVWLHLRQANPWYILLLLATFPPMIWIRAMRWRLLLPNRDQLSVPRLVDATILGFFASFVLPLRAGEIIRPWLLSRWQPVPFTSALASVLIERLSDSACLLALMVLCLGHIEHVPPELLIGGRILGVLTLGLIAVVLVSYLLPRQTEALFHALCRATLGRFSPHAAERANRMITDYFTGLRVIASFGQLVKVMLWSVAAWLLVALWYQILLWAFGEFPSFWVGMVLNVMIALAVAAPSAPGFLGTFQIGCILALSSVFGYPKEFAMAYSVIGHLLQLAFNVGAGLVVLHLRGLTLAQLRRSEA